jgi:hypothetical protein
MVKQLHNWQNSLSDAVNVAPIKGYFSLLVVSLSTSKHQRPAPKFVVNFKTRGMQQNQGKKTVGIDKSTENICHKLISNHIFQTTHSESYVNINAKSRRINYYHVFVGLQLSFWVGPFRVGKTVDIMVPPHMLSHFNEIVASLNLKSEVYISNVQQWVLPDVTLHRSETFYFVFLYVDSIHQFRVMNIQKAVYVSWHVMFSLSMFYCQLQSGNELINF